jgi:myo-inositol catabolism protein IolC
VTGEPRRLFALAFDHRSSLRRDFLGLTAAPTADDQARCRELKTVVFEGLVAGAYHVLAHGAEPAILVDQEYGADVIAQAKDHRLTLIVPVEVSGQAELRFEHGDDGFGAAIERVDPSYVKALVRYDPLGDPDLNRRQRARLGRLQGWLDDHGRDWMLEVLVPGDFETTVAKAIDELVDAGLRPAYWKLEGQASAAAYHTVAAATQGIGHCLVLGRGADAAAVERWLRLAAPVSDYRGFAVGRTLWWEPLRAFVHDPDVRDSRHRRAAVAAIAENYRRLVDVYLEAADRAS